MSKIKDLTGQRFGRLVALERAEKPKNKKTKGTYWLCQCDCGEQQYVLGIGLRSKWAKSCGCLGIENRNLQHQNRTIDLVGKKFGNLNVLKKGCSIKNHGGTRLYWVCKCDCGKVKEIAGDTLVKGTTKTCGCRNLKCGEAGLNQLFKQYQINAKKRNFDFNLTKEHFIGITQSNCYYCDSLPKQIKKNNFNGDFIYNGIDRINNDLGYSPENCVPCCGMCNGMKSHYDQDLFFKQIEKIYKKEKRRKNVQKI